MRIVIEKFPYEESKLLEALHGFTRIPPADDNGLVAVDYVGYCFLPAVNDCVFFLPKVVLQRPKEGLVQMDLDDPNNDADKVTQFDQVFGKYDPNTLLVIDDKINENDNQEKESNKNADRKFLYELSIWIYRTIREFKRLNPDTRIVARQNFSQVDTSKNRIDHSFIDVLLSLIQFNEENQDFFIFTIKNIHSGYNRINWRKTIAIKQPFVQNEVPIYMNPVNKKKQINFDDELFIIFFSILNYLQQQYGFPVKINFNYELITGRMFETYLEFFGVVRLKQIKYKYFSDRALKLWNLCYTFFEQAQKISSSNSKPDYLLAFNFETIFESMIDELIGQKDLPQKLKKQKDGKNIDHIYKYGDLVHPYIDGENQIYYIGDSKYYKLGGSVDEYSIYKQYTYAKNVIQFDFDLFFNKDTGGQEDYKKYHIGYVDELTEGYNITPNFFISAEINDYSFEEKDPKPRTKKGKDGIEIPLRYMNKQFSNRLFDRDTLWVSHYDINFLTVLSLYGRGNDSSKENFRSKVRGLFRKQVIQTLDDYYDFYLLFPINGFNLINAVENKFKVLHGKTYHPIESDYVILALEKKDSQNNQDLKNDISSVFDIKPYDIKKINE